MTQTEANSQTDATQLVEPGLGKALGAMSFTVRPMTLADIPAVMEIERASFPLPWSEQAYRYELLKNTNAYFIVAQAGLPRQMNETIAGRPIAPESRGWLERLLGFRPPLRSSPEDAPADDSSTITGYAGMWMFADEAHVSTIASHPAWRGRGVGELLLLSLMREAERRAAIFVTLEVRVSNTVAQNLYLKYGFEETGLRKRYYRDNGEDALIMTVQHFQRPEYKQRLADLEQALQRRLATA